MFAYCLDPLAHAHREHAGALMTLLALILVNRHLARLPYAEYRSIFRAARGCGKSARQTIGSRVRRRLISGSASGYCSASRWTRAETARDERAGRYVAQH